MQPTFSIIFVNYNTANKIASCIQSIVRQNTQVSYEIVIVDNKSPDRATMRELFSGIRHVADSLKVKLIESDRNGGFGYGCNLAASCAEGEFLFFLNGDTEFRNDVLQQFKEAITVGTSDGVGVYGCALSDENGEYVHSYDVFPQPANLAFMVLRHIPVTIFRIVQEMFGVVMARQPLPYQARPVGAGYLDIDYVAGAALVLSNELFTRTGGFNQRFFMYMEDVELQRRIRRSGFKRRLLFTPQIFHEGGGSFAKVESQVDNLKQRYYFRSVLEYCRLYNPFAAALVSVGIRMKQVILRLSSLFTVRR